ncbi:hypothetical protein J2Z31_004628 [Sinorhizobium kostiense]|uniref:Uncharacterized protein n=1 Tax=Sinorhizobium kostiense TaxID=76747 RepID=A0ABS4R5D4_9HYPH|nr:hypothetical protein [Sinorhizobium kostiense]MBP2238101.1 hypothetical protein [Sinorhizobium kostiense]
MIREEFQLLLQCPVCGVPCEAWPERMPVAISDVEGEADITGEFEIECDECGQTTDVTVTAHLLGWTAHVSGNPSHEVQVNHYDYGDDQWLEDLEPEPHPYTNYRAAISEWHSLLKELGEAGDASGRNRMLLVQLFSILEAYLSDAVISLVYNNSEILNAIVAWHPELKEEKVSLASVAANPHLVRDTIVSRLRKTQFHRFEHVNGMLRAAIRHPILPADKETRGEVLRAAKIRHDCVHRNGRDQEGNLVTGITGRYLWDLAGVFDDMVNKLHRRIEEEEDSRRIALLEQNEIW